MSGTSLRGAFPLHAPSAEDRAGVLGFLREVGFDEAGVCAALGLRNLGGIFAFDRGTADLSPVEPRMRTCLEFFVLGARLPVRKLEESWGEAVTQALARIGFVGETRASDGTVICPVWVYPVEGFIMASDRRGPPEAGGEESAEPPDDIVFPAIYPGTLRFLELLPDATGREVLDQCGGCGIGAMKMARTARSAATSDLTERSALFAGFNAALNGIAVESLCGDLFAPVAGRTFDLVTAHPPFVPSFGRAMVYRDAGDTGEEVTRRLVEALPAHLRPGGRCVVVCVARDTREAPFEQRVLGWLGQAGAGFDVVFAVEKVLTVGEVVDGMKRRGGFGATEQEELVQRLRELGTRQFVYGILVLERCGGVALPPLRLGLTVEARFADLERLLAWRRRRRSPGFEESVASMRVRLVPDLALNVRHAVEEGELAPVEFTFSVEGVLSCSLRLDGWVVPMIGQLTGARTVREVYETYRDAGELPAGFGLRDFAGLVIMLVERGFLRE